MDFNGNVVVVEQRDRSEGSQDKTSEAEKVQRLENDQEKDQETIASRRSSDLPSNGGSQNLEGEQSRKDSKLSQNYAKMCEFQRDQEYQANGNGTGFREETVWDCVKPDPWYDNCENRNCAIGFDGNPNNRNCKSGINISVVSKQEKPCENIEMEKPMYSVSFKRCYDSINSKWDDKRRKLFSSSCKSKKFKKQPNRCENASSNEMTGNPSNYRCTFENCCGNCEPYIVEVQNSDCSSCQGWQSIELEPRNACFQDCCCPRDLKVYPSNLSPQQSCAVCSENGKQHSPQCNPKCEFLLEDCNTPSKHCLQRVHFAKTKNGTDADHSACSFCSRKCTPSKASLFVEIGDSVADVCDLTSAQTFTFNDSSESLRDSTSRRESGSVKNGSDSLREQSRSKKSEPRCNTSCKGRPNAVARSYSDGIGCMEDLAINQALQEGFCTEMLIEERSDTLYLQDVRDCRAQTESSMYVNKRTTGCNPQCKTSERTLLGDVRSGKLWSQLQDTYKSFVKVASTSIGQFVKQSSKLKRSKKRPADRLTCGTCTKERDGDLLCLNQCNQSESCNEYMHGEACWKKMMAHESNNCDLHCCRNVCCEAMASLPDCQTPVCQSNYWSPNSNIQGCIASKKNWHDPCNDTHETAYSSSNAPFSDLQRLKYGGIRKRGGGDPNDQRRQMKSYRRPNQASKIQPYNRPNVPFPHSDRVTERGMMGVDVSVQVDTIRAVIDPTHNSFTATSIRYQRLVKAIKQLETFPEAPNAEGRDFAAIQNTDPARLTGKPIESVSTTPKYGTTVPPGYPRSDGYGKPPSRKEPVTRPMKVQVFSNGTQWVCGPIVKQIHEVLEKPCQCMPKDRVTLPSEVLPIVEEEVIGIEIAAVDAIGTDEVTGDEIEITAVDTSADVVNVSLEELTEEVNVPVDTYIIEQTIEDTLTEETPAEESAISEATPEESAVVEATPEESAIVETTPEESVIVEATPEESAVVEATPEESVIVEATPEESVIVEATPEESAVVEATPEELAIVKATPEESEIVEATPEESAVVEATPEESAIVETTPEELSAVGALPEESSIVEELPEESSAVEGLPEESSAVEGLPEESSIVEGLPEKSSAVEGLPEESSIVEAIPEESSAVETLPEKSSIVEPSNEETPVEEALVTEARADETPVEEASVTEARAEKTPLEEPAVLETTVDETEGREVEGAMVESESTPRTEEPQQIFAETIETPDVTEETGDGTTQPDVVVGEPTISEEPTITEPYTATEIPDRQRRVEIIELTTHDTDDAFMPDRAPATHETDTTVTSLRVQPTLVRSRETTDLTRIRPVDDSSVDSDAPAPIEFVREFRGTRTCVSVKMQTSHTMLTEIRSEFLPNNKRRQMLMNIELQTAEDDDDGTQQSLGLDTFESMPERGPSPTSSNMFDHQQRRMLRPGGRRLSLLRMRKPRVICGPGANGTSYPQRGRTHRLRPDYYPPSYPDRGGYGRGSCSGPCGR